MFMWDVKDSSPWGFGSKGITERIFALYRWIQATHVDGLWV